MQDTGIHLRSVLLGPLHLQHLQHLHLPWNILVRPNVNRHGLRILPLHGCDLHHHGDDLRLRQLEQHRYPASPDYRHAPLALPQDAAARRDLHSFRLSER
jgi:hypothetical protein